MKEEMVAALTAVRDAQQRLDELRKQQPPEDFSEHKLKSWDGGEVALAELFGEKRDLLAVHNMGARCPYCTMWADGFNGQLRHIADRTAFVVVSPDPIATQMEFAQSRGWRFRMCSAEGTEFTKAAGYQDENGSPWPGVSAFKRDEDGKVWRVSHAPFGPGDEFNGAFHLFDLLDGGLGGWQAKLSYE
jgi:predicted dithiol-disulfide oxidoreductase (DUF899 family)